jgi:single-stranded-DNA-specific exonuclease
MTSNFSTLVEKAASLIMHAKPSTRFRIISHYDADGITAATIMCKALFRKNYDFHVSLMRNPFTKGLEKVQKEHNDFIIFTDLGSGQLEMIEKIPVQSIIIDHHQLKKERVPDHILQINANQCGINGNYEACGASLSYAVAKAIDEKNKDLISYALAGAIGDKQYIGGFKGYNKTIVEEAVDENLIEKKIGLKLTEKTIVDSIYYSVEPFYKGLSGHKEHVSSFLKSIDIDEDKSYDLLCDDEKERLHSALMLILLKQGCESNILETVIRERFYHTYTYGEMEQFADLLDSCGKGGNRDLGLALTLGDQTAYDKAKNVERDYKKDLLEELLRLETEGAEELSSYRYFYTDHTSLGGVVGGIATNFIFDIQKPLLSIARKDHELHISCRGNQQLVKQGLDLGLAMSMVAEQLDGHGGGHKIAAGATIPSSAEKTFLQEVDNIISEQLKSNR